MAHVSKIKIEGRTFFIYQDMRGFWGIEGKHFINGKLNRRLDPVRDNLRSDPTACVRAIKTRVKVERMISSGMSPADAAMKIIFG